MRIAALALAATACSQHPAPRAPTPAPDVPIPTLQAVADEFDRAQLARDAAALERLVDPALVFITSYGAREDKAAFIAGWLDPNVTFEPIQIEERTFTPLGPDAGVVGGRVVLRGTAGGTAFASEIRFADTFRRVDGTWRAVYIQVTRVPAPAN